MSSQENMPSARLKADALGLVGTVSLTAAYMAPAASLIALFGVMVSNVGVAAGSVMLLGLVITLPSAISFGVMARELPSAGGVYAWARAALGESAGQWVGLSTAAYYLLTVFFPPIVFGQLFVELIDSLSPGITQHHEMSLWLLGVMISLAIGAWSTYRSVEVSSRVAFTMLVIQFVVMTALALHFTAVAWEQGRLTAAPFLPGASANGWSGILLALPLAMLSLVCDAATPASEETQNARRTIPLAILLTLLLVGAWDVLAFGALAMSAPADELMALSQDPVVNPVPLLAGRVWGRFKVVVTLIGMIAMLGALAPCSMAASRLIYSLGRDGVLPGWLGWIHPRHRTPWHGLHVVFVLTLAAVVLPALLVGPAPTIAWWGGVVVWFILVVYFAANLCNIVYYRRLARHRSNPLWNLFVPLSAMTIQVLVLWQVVVKEAWDAGWMGRTQQIAIAMVSSVIALYVWRRGRRSSSSGGGPVAGIHSDESGAEANEWVGESRSNRIADRYS
jgi:amino acid transporter